MSHCRVLTVETRPRLDIRDRQTRHTFPSVCLELNECYTCSARKTRFMVHQVHITLSRRSEKGSTLY